MPTPEGRPCRHTGLMLTFSRRRTSAHPSRRSSILQCERRRQTPDGEWLFAGSAHRAGQFMHYQNAFFFLSLKSAAHCAIGLMP